MLHTMDDSTDRALVQLLQSMGTVSIASITPEGLPHASSAPGLWHQSAIYFLLSELSPHLHYLTTQKTAGLLIHAQPDSDGAESGNVFARERLQMLASVECIPRDQPDPDGIIATMRARWGDTVDVLWGLSDFHLVACTPQSGRFIRGFGRAYEVTGDDWARVALIRS